MSIIANSDRSETCNQCRFGFEDSVSVLNSVSLAVGQPYTQTLPQSLAIA